MLDPDPKHSLVQVKRVITECSDDFNKTKAKTLQTPQIFGIKAKKGEVKNDAKINWLDSIYFTVLRIRI
jgi:hypothetical protein